MTGIFSSISGHFGKALILGAFFPAALFVLLNAVLLDPFVPDGWAPLAALRGVGPEWKTLAALGGSVLLAGLLYNLNTPIVRFYEGYPWKDSCIGGALTRSERARYREARVCWAGLRVLVDEIRAGNPHDPRLTGLDVLRGRLGQLVNGAFPLAESSVLPTRLGNTIRSFEDYPGRQYGMSAIALWPRLAAVLDDGYAAGVEDAKTSFDFTVNISVLSAASAAVLLFVGLASPGVLATGWAAWIAEVAGLTLAAVVFYRGAIGRAAAWGATVRGAFDLYRGPLLRQMGFAQQPAGLVEERALWGAISRQIVYGDPPPHLGSPLLYGERGSYVRARPAGVGLTLAKGVESASATEATVLLRVRNLDPVRDATQVVVTDTLPPGHAYLWGSARRTGGTVGVSGTDPYRFELGTLGPGEEAVLAYTTRKSG